MSRKKREPDPKTLLRFIAEHESLALTIEEFPELSEERLRQILRDVAEAPEPPRKSVVTPIEQAPVAKAAPVSTRRVVIHTDGACRGNPGPSGAGWVITTPEGDVLSRGSAFLGRRTNNEAEYEAVIHALRNARELGVEEIALFADSELLIKQVNGEYQVKNDRIAVLHAKARELMRHFRKLTAKHVRRELNREADAMANAAIDNDGDASSVI